MELDITSVSFDLPSGAALVRIWGVPVAEISQAANNNNKNIIVSAGFGSGLPLANPSQYGPILQGYVFQAYGNWIGTAQSMDLIVRAGPAPSAQGAQVNLSLSWKAGTPLADAVRTTLNTAYPGFEVDVSNLSPNLKFSGDLPGFYQSLTQFSSYIRQVSRGIINDPNYPGVSVVLQGKKFVVFDGTVPGSVTPQSVAFNDLIGQPTWINAPLIQFKTALRSDLKVGDNVTLPKTQVTNSAAAATSLVNQSVAFQGTFQILTMRHVGVSRQPDAAAWVTVFDAFPQQKAA